MKTKYIKIGSSAWAIGELSVLYAFCMGIMFLSIVIFRGLAILLPAYQDMFFSFGATFIGLLVGLSMFPAAMICLMNKGIRITEASP